MEKPQRPKPRDDSNAEPGDSREMILDAAAELFSTLGYAGTGLRQIADRVGIRPATVYHHFESKERILEEIMRTGLAETAQSTRHAIEVLPPESNPRDRVEAAVAGHLRGLYKKLTYTSTAVRFHGQIPPEVVRRIQPLRSDYSEYWRALLEDAKRAGYLQPELNVSLLRPLLLGTLNRTVAWFDQRQGPVDALIRTCIVSFSGIWTKERSLKLRNGNGLRVRRTASARPTSHSEA